MASLTFRVSLRLISLKFFIRTIWHQDSVNWNSIHESSNMCSLSHRGYSNCHGNLYAALREEAKTSSWNVVVFQQMTQSQTYEYSYSFLKNPFPSILADLSLKWGTLLPEKFLISRITSTIVTEIRYPPALILANHSGLLNMGSSNCPNFQI